MVYGALGRGMRDGGWGGGRGKVRERVWDVYVCDGMLILLS